VAAQPSFKSEIAEYRRALGRVDSDTEGLLMVAVLDRWEDHGSVETLWRKITAIHPGPPAQSFIGWLLDTRIMCERLREVVEKSPEVVAKVRAQAEKDWKTGSFEAAAWKRRKAENFVERADQELGRKKGDAPRQRFMRLASEMFIQNCGRPLDDVVASLTDIAFGDPVTTDAVRDARRSPKRRRDIQPPK
jgi:hypothetical protein